MKKLLFTLSAMILLSGISFASSQNIAVVDVQAVIQKSAQVKALSKEQKSKVAALDKWLQTAQADVQKQKTDQDKQKLLIKYNSEFEKKKETLVKDYQTKLQAIDKSITETITKKAEAMGYDMVISKTSVICGGNDITSEILKVVK